MQESKIPADDAALIDFAGQVVGQAISRVLSASQQLGDQDYQGLCDILTEMVAKGPASPVLVDAIDIARAAAEFVAAVRKTKTGQRYAQEVAERMRQLEAVARGMTKQCGCPKCTAQREVKH